MDTKIKREKRERRHRRVRAKIIGAGQRPRLCVFRSLKYIYAQLIDDEKGKTLVAVSDRGIKGRKVKTDKARETGRLIAGKAIKKKIKEVVFDRGGYKYHGKVKAVAEGAKEGGLVF